MNDNISSSIIYVAANGNPSAINTFGGTPHFMIESGLRLGLIAGGLPISTTEKIPFRKVAWNMAQLMRLAKLGGYQFSEAALASQWSQALTRLTTYENVIVLNFFQLFPDEIFEYDNIAKVFYIDQTLTQLFWYYDYIRHIDEKYARKVVAREKRQYEMAKSVIVTSDWARRSVVEDYGIASERVHVVVRGANVSEASNNKIKSFLDFNGHRPWATRIGEPLKLLFVGKDWYRKGLDRLIGACAIANLECHRVSLRVVGPKRENVPAWMRNVPNIEWLGFVDKEKNSDLYIDLLLSSDVGCLLSRAEAGGISLREFHLAGLATLVVDTGGTRDFAVDGASYFVAQGTEGAELARVLVEMFEQRNVLVSRQSISAREAPSLTWDVALGRILEVIDA